jgi:hypothetical protein
MNIHTTHHIYKIAMRKNGFENIFFLEISPVQPLFGGPSSDQVDREQGDKVALNVGTSLSDQGEDRGEHPVQHPRALQGEAGKAAHRSVDKDALQGNQPFQYPVEPGEPRRRRTSAFLLSPQAQNARPQRTLGRRQHTTLQTKYLFYAYQLFLCLSALFTLASMFYAYHFFLCLSSTMIVRLMLVRLCRKLKTKDRVYSKQPPFSERSVRFEFWLPLKSKCLVISLITS